MLKNYNVPTKSTPSDEHVTKPRDMSEGRVSFYFCEDV